VDFLVGSELRIVPDAGQMPAEGKNGSKFVGWEGRVSRGCRGLDASGRCVYVVKCQKSLPSDPQFRDQWEIIRLRGPWTIPQPGASDSCHKK